MLPFYTQFILAFSGEIKMEHEPEFDMLIIMLAAGGDIPSQTTKLLHTESCVTSSRGSDNIGKLIFLANFKAPSPTNKQWGVSSITFRASFTGFSISTTQPTAPNREAYLSIMNNNTDNIMKLVYLNWTLTFQKVCFICFNLSSLKMIKNTFCFILKALFVLKIFTFLFCLF